MSTTKRIKGVNFSYYQGDEIRQISVQEITNPIAFDNLNRPVKGGLYDPSLGVSPYDRVTHCTTCGQQGLACPGHIGHIELELPVYNPFLMTRLLQLLRLKCLACHHFRIPKQKLKMFLNLFKLIKLGYVLEAIEYKKLAENRYLRATKQKIKNPEKSSAILTSHNSRQESETQETSRKASLSSGSSQVSESHEEISASHITNDSSTNNTIKRQKSSLSEENQAGNDKDQNNQAFSMVEREKEILNLLQIKKHRDNFVNGISYTNFMSSTCDELTKEFYHSVAAGQCPYCNAQPAPIRKQGSTQFFISSTFQGKSAIHVQKKTVDESDFQQSDSDDESKQQEVKGEIQKGAAKPKPQNEKQKKIKQKFLNALQVKEHIKYLFEVEKKMCKVLFGTFETSLYSLENTKQGFYIKSNGYQMFFLNLIPVTPNRFRPQNQMGEQTFLHAHTVMLTKIISLNNELKQYILEQTINERKGIQEVEDQKDLLQSLVTGTGDNPRDKSEVNEILKRKIQLTDVVTKWIDLQDAVNTFFDSTKANKAVDREITGIRQLLEKKEGLFRMKMMGKRLNYTARSVISRKEAEKIQTDPNLNTNEVGVPLFMAQKLTFPEHVNQYNVQKLREYIIRGPYEHPGANFIIEQGNKIALEALSLQQRISMAKTLLHNAHEKTVYRHLNSGDVLLFNRQPTLHKPSLMSHIARVLPQEQTIRMNYANCKSYNADFDGDEMNLHFLQSHLARSEAYTISLNDNQYISATNGKPIRELMQDSIVSAIYLTLKDTFFELKEYQELLYLGVWNLFDAQTTRKITIIPPAIMRPKRLWTGKQLISNIIKIVASLSNIEFSHGLNMEAKAQLSSEEIPSDETLIVLRDNELMKGILDKNQLGSGADYGLIHAFHELYGANLTGKLFTALAKLFTCYLQKHGFTCGMDDLLVNQSHDRQRRNDMEKAYHEGVNAAIEFADLNVVEHSQNTWNLFSRPDYSYDQKNQKPYKSQIFEQEPEVDYISIENPILSAIERKLVLDPQSGEKIDNVYKSAMSKNASKILKSTLDGLIQRFPKNNFTLMVTSGAKGSQVNHTQVSALLGQQELEGRRVPLMVNGKSLPSFLPYDPNPRAGGFIGDRFLSGLRPQEFYFHCMAGREGLIDTAVKTSRSGYLQRCLMKHLESLTIAYDYTVRDADGSIIEFFYGEDGIDPMKMKYLDKFRFLGENYVPFAEQYDPYSVLQKYDHKTVKKFVKNRENEPIERAEIQSKRYNGDKYAPRNTETLMNKFSPSIYLGSISQQMHSSVQDFVDAESNKLNTLFVQSQYADLQPAQFKALYNIKYINLISHPGDCVGCVAAQAIGEPSTQMTLNTFHLAGHGGVNLTLGIPRLREILMTASDKIKTPIMSMNIVGKDITKLTAQNLARKLKRVKLLELVQEIKVIEKKRLKDEITGQLVSHISRARIYEIQINLQDMKAIQYAYGLSMSQILTKFQNIFIPNLLFFISKELQKDHSKELEASIVKQMKEDLGGANDSGDEIDEESALKQANQALSVDQQFSQESKGKRGGLTKDVQVEEDEDSQEIRQKTNNDDDDELEQIFSQAFQESKIKEQDGATQMEAEDTKKSSKSKQQANDNAKRYRQSEYFENLTFDDEAINLTLKVPLNSQKLLMVNVIQKLLEETLVYEVKGISNSLVMKTQGVNFKAIWKLDFVDPNDIYSNDIHAILQAYGIEAARRSIIDEIIAVFDVYGVTVDYRHLFLIADYMTFSAKIKAMNRSWMEESISPFLKMSFQTCVNFLTNAACFNEKDNIKSPSSAIVLGRVPNVGTGVCEIIQQF